jgi:Zinc dependent phospholipase C
MILLLWLFVPSSVVLASGGLTHQTIAELALDKLPPSLQKILKDHQEEFRNGVFHPDVLYFMADNLGFSKEDSEAGHLLTNTTNNYVNELLKLKRTQGCKSIEQCPGEAAFLLGALAHMVTDGHFDLQFVGKYDNVGRKGVTANCGVNVPTNRFGAGVAERFTDFDLDLCLAKRLSKIPDLIPIFNRLPAIEHPDTAAICPAGQFLDIFTWKCWSCPPGYDRSPFNSIKDSAACFRMPHTKTQPAQFLRNNTEAFQGCPTGYFWDGMGKDGKHTILGSCWSCGAGWTRSAEPVTSAQACFQGVPLASAPATEHKAPGCPAGSGPDLQKAGCWSCPSGYVRTTFPVDGPMACEQGVKQCEKLTDLPNIAPPLPTRLPARGFDDLVAAYGSTGVKMSPISLPEASLAFLLIFRFEGAADDSRFTNVRDGMPNAKSIFYCDWGLKNFATAPGGINDSARVVTDFLNNAAQAMNEYLQGGDIAFIRQSNTTYAILRNGVEYYRNP